jgi:hypothetical protein
MLIYVLVHDYFIFEITYMKLGGHTYLKTFDFILIYVSFFHF